MIVSTTPTLEGHKIEAYYGIVVGEAVMGANVFKDLFASIRDIVGGRLRCPSAFACPSALPTARS